MRLKIQLLLSLGRGREEEADGADTTTPRELTCTTFTHEPQTIDTLAAS